MSALLRISTLFLCCVISSDLYAQTIIDLNTYLDSRKYFNGNINLLHTQGKWQYFSLSDIRSNDYNVDLNSFYSEHNLRYSVLDNKYKITYQGVHRTGINNDKYRLGLLVNISNILVADWFKKVNTWYFVNFHFIEMGYNYQLNAFPQMEHVYKINLFKNKVYVNGFLDHNISVAEGKLVSKIVTEHQVGYNFYKNLFFVTEVRLNQFMNNPFGVGIGLEVLLK